MKILIHDIETPASMFLLSAYDPEKDQMFDFIIDDERNDLDAMMKFIETYQDYYWVGYNNIRFDSQVIEFIIRSHEGWFDKSSSEIRDMIRQKAVDVIDNGNYDIFPEYPEKHLTLKQIDLFTIWHFNNKNKATSLKAIEFAIDFENIEEMPTPHAQRYLTPGEKKDMIDYCHNDVMATYQFYLITRGQTELKNYKGKDKIGDRLIMKEEFGLDCLNWDDVKIGAEWNKMDYIALTKRAEHTLKPEKVNHFYGKKFKQFFPRTVSFQTPGLKKFVREFGESFILNKKQEFQYRFNHELLVTIAKGGIHSTEKGRMIIPGPGKKYIQCDIGSQYPNAIRKFKVEPKHLPGWNGLIVSKIDRRLNYKSLWKKTKDPKYASLQEMGKLSLNGGAYGRLNTQGDWQEDPCCMMQVTIGCQLEILMIVEDLLTRGFRVVSLNTDGFDVVIDTDREDEFKTILGEFEVRIGNDFLGNFEYTDFQWIAQTSVNDYLALKTDGEYKAKGDFEIDKEIHKNKSARIVPIALKEYFVNKVPVEETVKKHTNIYDFCIRQKSSKNFHYEGYPVRKRGKKLTTADLLKAGWELRNDYWFKPGSKGPGQEEQDALAFLEREQQEQSTRKVYDKLIRYYISHEGEKIYKIKNPECDTNAADVSQVDAGEWLCKVCNYLPKDTDPLTAGINHDYYIEKANTIIYKIEGRRKPKKVDPAQMSLF